MKKRLLTALALLSALWVVPAQAAIALDTSTDGGITNPGTSHTFSHTCTGSNLILFVSVFGDVASGGDNITGVTYNGVSMTLVNKIVHAVDRWVYLYVLVGPATGAHNVVVSASASIAIASHAVSYTGAAQSGQPDAQATAEDSDGDITASVTTVADNSWTVLALRCDTTGGTASTGSTQRQASNGLYTADSNGPKTPAGSTSMRYTSCNTQQAAVIASFAPDTGGGGGSAFGGLSSLGVGR